MSDAPMIDLVVPDAVFATGRPVLADGTALTAEDRLELTGLTHRFEYAAGSRRRADLFELLTEDVLVDHGQGAAEGRQALTDLGVPTEGLRHLLTNHVVYVEEGVPWVLCHMTVIQVVARGNTPPGPLPLILDQGLNRYAFRREGGRWRISRMIFEQQKLADWSGAPADVVEAFALTEAERAELRAGKR